MTKRKARKYVPTVLVKSDDLTITDEEGNEHRPHEGEWVRFRRGVPGAFAEVFGQFQAIEEPPEDAPEDERTAYNAAQATLYSDMLDLLAHQITDWNWTDEDWEPLPRPADDRRAFRRALGMLETYEITWLNSHLADGANVPNGSSSPSASS